MTYHPINMHSAFVAFVASQLLLASFELYETLAALDAWPTTEAAS